ncbi:hypothetical protein Slin15195_G035360 [Septoria linicola]|uniref:Uncharacterized protein n=1 Tax=Septoria linicola TaxID=215465 RepID=A0A9Q9AQG8_9PEZI|nr:hypothetical protein Slin14017_G116720 [Septoria linicola]USW50217.1 hypothetical protein Slin15195_G035360 [Septoria linicola]
MPSQITANYNELATCELLSTTPEIRNRIYEFVFAVEPTRTDRPPRNDCPFVRLRHEPSLDAGQSKVPPTALSLLVTCRKVFSEAAGMFYHQNNIMLTISGPHNMRSFMAATSRPRLDSIRRLSIFSGNVLQSLELCAELYRLPRLEEIFFYDKRKMTIFGNHDSSAQMVRDLRDYMHKVETMARGFPKVKKIHWCEDWDTVLPAEKIKELDTIEAEINAVLPANSVQQPTPSLKNAPSMPRSIDSTNNQLAQTYRGENPPKRDTISRPSQYLGSRHALHSAASTQETGPSNELSNPPSTFRIVTKRNARGQAIEWEKRINHFPDTISTPTALLPGGKPVSPPPKKRSDVERRRFEGEDD